MNHYFNVAELSWLLPFIRAGIILVMGYYVATFLSRKSENLSSEYASPQQVMLIKKIIYFSILLMFAIASLQQLNFQLSALLGSAGVATVAIGFAAKTSISNMICGLFLILEKSFVVGDTICVKGHQGEILSIDFLSIKIRTPENTMVRLPNEEIFSSDVINLTHFEQRRLDIAIAIRYDTDLANAQKRLLKLAAQSPFNAQKPEAAVILDNFAESAINLRLSIWVDKADYYEAKNSLQQAIKTAFDQQGLQVPYPQLQVQITEKL